MPDDTGLDLRQRPERVVSLVPSLTEAIAVTAPGRLVGATDWCSHPADLDVVRLRGTKNPDIDGVLALRPDVVVVNLEENRAADIAALTAAGVPVWTTSPSTVPEALSSLDRLCAALGRPDPDWLQRARAVWAGPVPAAQVQAVVPIWRRPWMVLGRDTFAGDLLARLGVGNVYAGHDERYPRIAHANLASADLVVLPDEPYAFSATDGPEAFPGRTCALVSGRHLTWYGPSLAEAREVLTGQLAPAGADLS